MKRRDFVKTVAMSGLAIAAGDTIADLVAQTPNGRVLESKFKGLSDVALAEAKRAGCSYADIRFTRSTSNSITATGSNNRDAEALGGFGGRGGGRGGRGGGNNNAGAGAGSRDAAGFGVRVIHSGVWGFAASPIVTEDEIRRITRVATEVARASAIARKADVVLAPVPAYIDYWATPMKTAPGSVAQEAKQALVQQVVDVAITNKEAY